MINDATVEAMRRTQRGKAPSVDFFPKMMWCMYKDKRLQRQPDIFSAGGFWTVSVEFADVLRRFDHGRGALDLGSASYWHLTELFLPFSMTEHLQYILEFLSCKNDRVILDGTEVLPDADFCSWKLVRYRCRSARKRGQYSWRHGQGHRPRFQEDLSGELRGLPGGLQGGPGPARFDVRH